MACERRARCACADGRSRAPRRGPRDRRGPGQPNPEVDGEGWGELVGGAGTGPARTGPSGMAARVTAITVVDTSLAQRNGAASPAHERSAPFRRGGTMLVSERWANLLAELASAGL